jgi:hypothetical protein
MRRKENTMHRIAVEILFLLLFFLSASGYASTSEISDVPPRTGDLFPRISFSNVLTHQEQAYLGVGKKRVFSLQNIPGDILIVMFLNTHCPICIKSLAVCKEAFETIERDQNLQGAVRLVGISVGNTVTEVTAFREEHTIPYPIIPDPEFKVHKAAREPAVPFVVVCLRDEQRRWLVAVAHLGSLPETLIDEIRAILGVVPKM